jgi:type VI secretion system protein VasG
MSTSKFPSNSVLPRIAVEYLTRVSLGDDLRGIGLASADGDFAYRFA